MKCRVIREPLLQFIFGSFDFLLSEQSSTRSGISRFASFAGSTTILGSAIPFAIIFIDLKQNILPFKIQFNYFKQITLALLMLVSIMTLSRSAIILSFLSFAIIFFKSFYCYLRRIFLSGKLSFSLRFKIQSFLVPASLLSALLFILPRFSLFEMLGTWFKVMFGFASKSALVERGMTTETNDLLSDSMQRLTWFKSDLTETPFSILLGHGTDQFGGVLGISESYAHNTFIDVFQASGLIGLLLFSSFLLLCFVKSSKIKESFSYLGLMLIFVTLTLFNSGTLFHPLLIFPILYIACI